MSKRKLIGKSKLTNVYDKSGVYTTDEITSFEMENKSLLLTGVKHRRHDVYTEFTGNVDPYYNHVITHIPGAAYDTHVLKDQSGNNFDEFLFANDYRIESGINESGPKEYHSVFFRDQSYEVTDAASLRLGTNNFTIEFWMKTGRAIGTESYVMGKGTGSGRASGGTGWVVYLTSGNLIGFYDGLANSSTQSSTAITHDTWAHIAIVRSAGAINIYQNGVNVATGTSSGNFTDTATMYIGRDRNNNDTTFYGGYLFDLRIRATAVYSANFTAPTDILDMSNSVLSISGADPYHPYQTAIQREGLTIAPRGGTWDIRKYPDHPFFVKFPRPTGSGMSCSVRADERGYQIADQKPGKSLQFGTGAFTIECWVFVSYQGRQNQFGIAGKGTGNAATAGATGWSFLCNGTQLQWSDGASALVTGTVALGTSGWNHVAAVREGTGTNQFKMYVNGQLSYTGTLASNYNQTSPLVLCASRNHEYQGRGVRFFGMRISTNARYTAPFTIARSTFYDTVATNDANTLLYMFDTKDKRARPFKPQYINDGYEVVSCRARGTTGQHRVGSRGLYTGGHSVLNITGGASSTLFTSSTQSSYSFGTGDFSIEFWICNQYEWESGNTTPRFLFDCRANFNDATGFGMRYNFRALQVITGGMVILADSSAYFPQRAWSHICLQRTAGNLAIYVNGDKRAETYYANTMAANGNKMYFMNGAFNVRNDQRWYGWMSDIRILNGSGAYSVANSNPDRIRVPTEPLTAIGNTVLLTAGQPTLRDYSGVDNLVWAGNRPDSTHTSSWDVWISGFSPYTSQDKSNNMITDFWDGSYSGGHSEPDWNTGNDQMIELTWMTRLAKPWTIEVWMFQPQTNPSAIDTAPTVVYCAGSSNENGWQLITNYASGANSYNDVSFVWRSPRLAGGANEFLNTSASNTALRPHSWNHIAVVYDPSKTTKVGLFVNGKRVATRASLTQSYSFGYTYRIQHGGYHGAGDVKISDVARYDIDQTTYTIPSATSWNTRDINTAYHLKIDNGLKDRSQNGLYIVDGLVRPSYQYTKWGSGSIGMNNLNSAANYDKIFMNPSGGGWSERGWDIRIGDFTVEGWAQWKDATAGGKAVPTSAPGACIFHQGNYIWVGINASGNWALLNRGGSTTNFTPTIINSVAVATSTAGTWNHWALVRKDGDYHLYVDGLLVARHLGGNHWTYTSNGPTADSQSSNDDWYNIYDVRVGYEYNETAGTFWCGHLEDFRMTALARYSPGVVNGVWTMCHNGTNIPGLPTAPFPTR